MGAAGRVAVHRCGPFFGNHDLRVERRDFGFQDSPCFLFVVAEARFVGHAVQRIHLVERRRSGWRSLSTSSLSDLSFLRN